VTSVLVQVLRAAEEASLHEARKEVTRMINHTAGCHCVRCQPRQRHVHAADCGCVSCMAKRRGPVPIEQKRQSTIYITPEIAAAVRSYMTAHGCTEGDYWRAAVAALEREEARKERMRLDQYAAEARANERCTCGHKRSDHVASAEPSWCHECDCLRGSYESDGPA
jgi:hypothetical protein